MREKNKELLANAKSRGIDLKASKSLGLVDLKTGIYVPKDDNKVIGKVGTSGDYIPPKGLKLDTQKGFVAVKKENEEKAKDLNKELIKDQLVPDETNPAYRRYFDIED